MGQDILRTCWTHGQINYNFPDKFVGATGRSPLLGELSVGDDRKMSIPTLPPS
jgi:hypothetical protein